jgi:hypothetical protein
LTSIPETCSGCCNGEIIVNGPTNGCAPYLITLNPGNLVANNGDFTNLCGGITYILTIQDIGCCPTATDTSCVDFDCGTTSIKEIIEDDCLVNFDNIHNIIIIESKINNSTIKIFDISGKLVKSEVVVIGTSYIDIAKLENGVYILNLFSKDKIFLRKKITKY